MATITIKYSDKYLERTYKEITTEELNKTYEYYKERFARLSNAEKLYCNELAAELKRRSKED